MSTALPGDHQLTANEHNKLKAGTVGLFGVLFMALANAAPITAMTGNVPIAIAFGNGIYAPAGFVVATIVLTLFTIGFISMARYITTTGAFYGFISHGLGQVWGMATGFMATMCYIVFEGSLIGIFAYFASQAIETWTGTVVNWLLIALVGIILVGILGYFDISIAAKLLGFFLVCEVVLLAALAFSVLFKGGGPDGLMSDIVNPLNAFKGLPEGGGLNPAVMVGDPAAPIVAGAAALGVFFAFWSWIGFETTAVYGEESRNPRKIVPQATLFAVIALGLFYSFVSWMVIAGNGANQAITKSYTNAITMFTDLAVANLGGEWVRTVYLVLIVSGSFACALAFHNAASRYLYAIGREVPALRSNLGTTHATHGSPHISSIVQTIITILLTIGFYFLTPNGSDVLQGGYIFEYGLLALLGTLAILLVMAICSIAVIWYFWVKKVHTGNIFSTLIAPALGFLGMMYVVYLLLSNITFAGGGAAGSAFFVAIPWITVATFVAGLLFALWIKSSQPDVYAEIGRTVLEEAHERV